MRLAQVQVEPRDWSVPPQVYYTEPQWFWYGVLTGVVIGVTLGLLVMDAVRSWWPAYRTMPVLLLGVLATGCAVGTAGVRYVGGPVQTDTQDCKASTGGENTAMHRCMLGKGYSAEMDVPGRWGSAGGQEWPASVRR